MSSTTLTTTYSAKLSSTLNTKPITTHFSTIPTKQFFGDKRQEDRAVRAAGSRRNAKLPGHVYAREILLHHAVRDNLPVPAGTPVGLEQDCPALALFQRHIHNIQAFAEDLLAQRIHQE